MLKGISVNAHVLLASAVIHSVMSLLFTWNLTDKEEPPDWPGSAVIVR
jgi:hypothetical protein